MMTDNVIKAAPTNAKWMDLDVFCVAVSKTRNGATGSCFYIPLKRKYHRLNIN
jgi:hypothetical protein